MGSDQRGHTRVDTNVPVLVHGGEGSQSGAIRNLSAGGAAIEFDPALGKSTVSFDLGDAVDVQPQGVHPVRGRIVRSHAGGIAMQFDAVQDNLLDALTAARDIQR